MIENNMGRITKEDGVPRGELPLTALTWFLDFFNPPPEKYEAETINSTGPSYSFYWELNYVFPVALSIVLVTMLFLVAMTLTCPRMKWAVLALSAGFISTYLLVLYLQQPKATYV